MDILDFVFPKRCVQCREFGGYLCPQCFSRISFDTRPFCLVCNKGSIDGLTHPRCQGKYVIDGCFASIVYQGVVKKLIYTFKYQPYLSDLQRTLIDLFYEGIIQKEVFYRALGEDSLLVPIPLHKNRLRKRDYNQVGLIASGLGDRLNRPVVPLLRRVKMTKLQFGLTRTERIANIKDAFVVTGEKPVKDSTIFLIDDIVTSGATLLEAARVLKRTGYTRVYGLTLAHGQ